MKIAVNTRLLLHDKLEGIGQFAHESLRRIVVQHPEHRYFFLFDRPFSEEFIYSDRVTPIVAYPPARHPYLWYLFFEYGIPYRLRQIKPDLFLSPDGWLPLHLPCKSVDVIHDLNFEHHPDFIKPTVLRYYHRFFHRFAQKAARIAAVSQFTKEDIQQLYDIPADRIDVVYNGCNERFQPLPTSEQTKVREQFTQGCDFFLFVGLIHKRKNLTRIFKAFDEFKAREPNPVKLVVAGDKKWWRGEIENTYLTMQFRDEVILMGRQNPDILQKLMASARALVYTSLFEGFGIPILEAFHAETAVITSNLTSMPEIAGSAAWLVNPHSVNSIAEALHRLWKDDTLRNNLIQKGRERRTHFSWQQTADRLWQTIETTCNMNNV